jgi:LAO/AO transport system kinase
MGGAPPARPRLTLEQYAEGVLAGDRAVLARAITLVESNAAGHEEMAARLLERVAPAAGGAWRVGITGAPGVGKSTLIEELGLRLTRGGDHKVAVLAVDPSSSVSRGSILGDKTRMPRLSREEGAFIRPSPAGASLGGVARKTREAMLLCEAAGFDMVLVETVGVGQSEVAIRSMVDFFLLLLLPGAGDELQGIKRGVVELADALCVTKDDGESESRAHATRDAYAGALTLVVSPTPGWMVPAMSCSGLTGKGLEELWATVETFFEQIKESGQLEARRRDQALEWMHATVKQELERRFYEQEQVKALLPELEKAVLAGKMPPTVAACTLLEGKKSN